MDVSRLRELFMFIPLHRSLQIFIVSVVIKYSLLTDSLRKVQFFFLPNLKLQILVLLTWHEIAIIVVFNYIFMVLDWRFVHGSTLCILWRVKFESRLWLQLKTSYFTRVIWHHGSIATTSTNSLISSIEGINIWESTAKSIIFIFITFRR